MFAAVAVRIGPALVVALVECRVQAVLVFFALALFRVAAVFGLRLALAILLRLFALSVCHRATAKFSLHFCARGRDVGTLALIIAKVPRGFTRAFTCGAVCIRFAVIILCLHALAKVFVTNVARRR